MKKIIELKDAEKIYQTKDLRTIVFQNLNFKLHEGDFISICGESGGGKSTLLSILGLIDEVSKGQMLIENTDVTQLSFDEKSRARNKYIGTIYQSFNLIDELTVFENIALPLKYRGLKSDEIASRVNEYLNLLGISHRADHEPALLSGGQQQRVAIARAMVCNPSVLLIDEATGNLDSKNSKEIMDLVCKLNDDGTTICMVTHEEKYANLAKNKLYLEDGRLIGE